VLLFRASRNLPANHYAISLGTDGAFGSTLIGASSFAAIFAAFLFSFWYTKSSFRSALLFSSLAPFLGNILYSVAISYKSMNMALAGRILCGFGSAEVVNRQLISACVSFSNMTRASALFVAAGAIGMGVGPLMAGILENVFGTDTEEDIQMALLPQGGIIINHITAPGFVMSTLWFLVRAETAVEIDKHCIRVATFCCSWTPKAPFYNTHHLRSMLLFHDFPASSRKC